MPIRVLLSDDEALARERLRSLLEDEPDLEIVAECGDGKSAISLIKREKPDLVFLDIQMPEVDGFGVVSALRDQHMPLTIFVTAYDRYAMKAFEVHALDYLLKPVVKERLTRSAGPRAQAAPAAVGRRCSSAACSNCWPTSTRSKNAPQRIVIKADGEIVCLKPDEIDWAESAGNYVCLHVGSATAHSARDDYLAGIAAGPAPVPARTSLDAGERRPHQDAAAVAVRRLLDPAARRHQADAQPRLPRNRAEAAGDGVEGPLFALRDSLFASRAGAPLKLLLLEWGFRFVSGHDFSRAESDSPFELSSRGGLQADEGSVVPLLPSRVKADRIIELSSRAKRGICF